MKNGLMNLIQMFLFMELTKKRVYEIKQLPVGFELSDGDRAALYGWPDRTVEEVADEQS